MRVPLNVHFDPAVADECRRTSALLADLTGQRVRLAAKAREHWRGRNPGLRQRPERDDH
jgi:hypothetical protein